MKKILFIIAAVFFFFLVESLLSNFLGRWFQPNLLLLLVIFMNLAFGVRYSIVAALVAGFCLDSFSSNTFGINMFSLVVCAYMTTFVKRYLYQFGSIASRVSLTFAISIINILIQYVMHSLFVRVDFSNVFYSIMLPEVIVTTLMSAFIFRNLKQCVLKLLV